MCLKTPEIDKAFCRWTVWLAENTNQKEKDLIYVTENYQKAWLTASEIRTGEHPMSLRQDNWKE